MNFVDLLRRMSSVEAKIIDYACKNSTKFLYPNKLIMSDGLTISFETLVEIAGTKDIYRLDSELDHMRSIELLVAGDSLVGGAGGFTASDIDLEANITPSPLALNLYYRTHSTGISPIEFWGDRLISCTPIDIEAKHTTDLKSMWDDAIKNAEEKYKP